MANLVKPIAGQPFRPSAGDHSAFIDAYHAVQTLKSGIRTIPAEQSFSMNVSLIKNESGGTIKRGEILGIESVFPLPADDEEAFKNGPIFKGTTPAIDDHWGNFAVLLTTAKDDAIVPAVFSGMTVCQVTVATGDEDIETADVKDGDAVTLQALPCGSAKIIWKESGTGVVHAVVNLGTGGTGRILVQLSADLLFSNSTGVTATIWTGFPATTLNQDITGVTVSEKIATSGTFLEDSFAYVERSEGRFVVTGAPCL